MPPFGFRWYVLRTKPCKEKWVAEQIERRNIQAYFPLLKTFRKYLEAGRRQVEPLFPCYLFARAELASCYETIRRLSGLREVVRFGEHFPHLEDAVIAEFRRRETKDGYIRVRPAHASLRAREPVLVTEGLFAGHDGLFSGYLNAPDRVCVLLHFLQSRVRVELPAASIRPEYRVRAAGLTP